jgi:hypothetical protein
MCLDANRYGPDCVGAGFGSKTLYTPWPLQQNTAADLEAAIGLRFQRVQRLPRLCAGKGNGRAAAVQGERFSVDRHGYRVVGVFGRTRLHRVLAVRYRLHRFFHHECCPRTQWRTRHSREVKSTHSGASLESDRSKEVRILPRRGPTDTRDKEDRFHSPAARTVRRLPLLPEA